jgi:hypothetical protein
MCSDSSFVCICYFLICAICPLMLSSFSSEQVQLKRYNGSFSILFYFFFSSTFYSTTLCSQNPRSLLSWERNAKMDNVWRNNVVITVLHILFFMVSVATSKMSLFRVFHMSWISHRSGLTHPNLYNREFYVKELKVCSLCVTQKSN